MSKILVIIPTYNERENLKSVVVSTLELKAGLDILIIDDNSPDGTGRIADELAAAHGEVKVMHRAGKEGLGKAYREGFKYAINKGYDNWPFYRVLISRGGSLYTRLITRMPLRDCTGGFTGFRCAVLKALNPDTICSGGYSFQIEMKYRSWKMGYRLVQIPIIFVDRKIGKSKMSKKIFLEAMGMVWKLRFGLQ
ncbi:MAG: glycosyltransferase [Candidatus Aureabacteria bacterium]|nr:glycosyltransferase [Candidatus Auribacterota bacterium]